MPANPPVKPVCGHFYIDLTDKMIVQMQSPLVNVAEDIPMGAKSVEIVKKNRYNG